MIFVQPLYYNFLTTFSLILTLYSCSLSSFFSLYCFGPMRREHIKVVIKVVPNGCTYITTLYKIVYIVILHPNYFVKYLNCDIILKNKVPMAIHVVVLHEKIVLVTVIPKFLKSKFEWKITMTATNR